MLINALCDYYDILVSQNKVLPEGFSKVGISYMIALTPEGKIDAIVNCQNKNIVTDKKGKEKTVSYPKEMLFPERSEKTAIAANIIEHRPTYIFGLLNEGDKLTADDAKKKAAKSHEALLKTNLEFIEGLDSPVINAYRNFLTSWEPAQETENNHLLELGKKLSVANFCFCLSGHPERLLQDDPAIKEKWLQASNTANADTDTQTIAQCAVTGQKAPIARIHRKIKNVADGQSSGTTLVGFNNPSEESYGRTQSYNSNISEAAMLKYCEALNYLLASKKNRVVLDGVTFIFWAAAQEDAYDDCINDILFGADNQLDTEATENLLAGLAKDVGSAAIVKDRLRMDNLDPDIDFYIAGIKPNASRLALKFLHHKKFGDILQNIAQHQADLQIGEKYKPLTLKQILRELISPKSKNEKVDPALLTKLLEAIIFNRPYPHAILAKAVQRVQTDVNLEVEDYVERTMQKRRACIIKACLNRYSRAKNMKEEFDMALDINNNNQAYLCGRLFACLEKVQNAASKGNLNRTIKDTYFPAASRNPKVIFPRLMYLYENHQHNLDTGLAVHYDKLIGSIMNMLAGEFPSVQTLDEQGKFIIGYYQQMQDFFKKKEEA